MAIRFSADELQRMRELIENPPPPTEALRDAVELYREGVQLYFSTIVPVAPAESGENGSSQTKEAP